MAAFDKKLLACDFNQSKTTRDAYSPVVTPENIPRFTIPPLAIPEGKRVYRNMMSLLPTLRHSQNEEALEGKTLRSFSFSFEDLPDPVTRAAMSLPHLEKITTPYGFITLAESPHVPSEETVFFQMRTSRKGIPMVRSFSLQNTLISDAKYTGRSSTSPDTVAQSSDHNSSSKSFLPFKRTLLFRQSSMPVINNGSNVKATAKDKKPAIISQRSNSFPKITRNSSPNLLQSVIKKHFSAKKQESKSMFASWKN